MSVSVAESVEEYKRIGSFDREKRALQMKEYYEKHRGKILVYARAYFKKYYLKNKAREVARVAKWKRNNAGKVSAQGKRRYEKKMRELRGVKREGETK